MLIFAIARHEIRRIFRNPFSVLALCVVLALPALYAGLYLQSLWNPNRRMNELPAALVVEDRGPVGQEAARRMLSRHDLRWIRMSRKEAENALFLHKVYLSVRFPEDFSEALESLKGPRPRPALLDCRFDQGGSYLVSQLGTQAIETLREELARTVRTRFDRTVLFGIRETGAGLRLAAEKAELLAKGAGKVSQGNEALADGSLTAVGGIHRLRRGIETLDEGGKRLSNGMTRAHQGGRQLSEGLRTMSGKLDETGKKPVVGWVLFDGLGLRRLDEGVNQAASGSARLVEAQATLADGATRLEQGLGSVAGGAVSLEGGFRKLRSGLVLTADGNRRVQAGTALLARKLGEAGRKIQVADPEKLAPVAADPVRLELRMVNPVPNYGTGFAPFFIPLVLWIGAIALFFMLDARDLALQFSTAGRWDLVLGRFLCFGAIGVGQALILSASLIHFLGLSPVHPAWFYLTNVLMSLAFVAVVGMLISLFSLAGRFAVLILLLFQLTSSGGTFPLELNPLFFRILSPFLPMSYGVRILRPILSGGLTTEMLWRNLGPLCTFLFGALFLMVLLIRRRMMIRELYEPSPVF